MSNPQNLTPGNPGRKKEILYDRYRRLNERNLKILEELTTLDEKELRRAKNAGVRPRVDASRAIRIVEVTRQALESTKSESNLGTFAADMVMAALDKAYGDRSAEPKQP